MDHPKWNERPYGLCSSLSFKCNECEISVIVDLQPKQLRGRLGKRHFINVASVWGFVSTGGGHAKMDEILSLMSIPSVDRRNFHSTEMFITKEWRQQLAQEMLERGKEERRLAMECGESDEGVPAIDVIVDGGWSMRSNHHRYSAKSGVACIIGRETNKLLFLSVRNKYCSVCSIAKAKTTDVPEHHCFKNWDGSSSAIEQDIIVEGFSKSEQMHGLRYIGLIGDGDSSVYSKIIENVPYGRRVKKKECANHAVRCYRKSLHDLVNTHTEWKGRNSLTEQKIRRIAAGAREAIRMHAKTGNVDLLRKDLRNGPYHVFGDHRNCNEEFCSSKRTSRKADCETLIIKTSTDGESSSNNVETKDGPNYSDATNTDDRAQIFQMVKEIEEEADDEQSMLAEEEEARKGGQYMIDKLPHGLFAEILKCGNRSISVRGRLSRIVRPTLLRHSWALMQSLMVENRLIVFRRDLSKADVTVQAYALKLDLVGTTKSGKNLRESRAA